MTKYHIFQYIIYVIKFLGQHIMGFQRNDHNSNFLAPKKNLINFKEALIFGFLGLLKFFNKKNVLKSVTGAKISTSSGILIK